MFHDTHNHTKYSIDSMMDIHEAIEKAKFFNIKMTFTEHCDVNEFNENGLYTDFDKASFFAEYEPLRKQGLVNLGIELGIDSVEPYVSQCEQQIKAYPYDIVVGSVHNFDGQSVPYWYREGKMDKVTYYKRYLKQVADAIRLNPLIDTFAHIDYPSRYSKFDINPVYYEDFPELFDQIFAELLNNNTLLEINQKKIDEPDFYNALLSILKQYRAKGNLFVTIGGDNHIPETIGVKYELARKLAKEADLEAVYFENRQMFIDQDID